VNPYRLRLPGPTAVPERVRLAMARPLLAHRGPEFRRILARAEELLRPILGTWNHVFFHASTGTGMMEAALVNVLAPGERVLVAVHGQFGERFGAIAGAMGASWTPSKPSGAARPTSQRSRHISANGSIARW